MKPKQANNKADFETCQVPEGASPGAIQAKRKKKMIYTLGCRLK
jgi:hypothetical protein